jgi:hypothetical protein
MFHKMTRPPDKPPDDNDDDGPSTSQKPAMVDKLTQLNVKFRKNSSDATLRALCVKHNVPGYELAPAKAPTKAAADKKAMVDALVARGVDVPKKVSVTVLKELCVANNVPGHEPAKKTKRQEMVEALASLGVATKKKAAVPELFGLCVEHKLSGYEYDQVTRELTTTVKCALRHATGLDDASFAKFRAIVDDLVNVISRMSRRASLALAHHVHCLIEDGRAIPNLAGQKDTYWKRWLTIGLYADAPLEVKIKVLSGGKIGLSVKERCPEMATESNNVSVDITVRDDGTVGPA